MSNYNLTGYAQELFSQLLDVNYQMSILKVKMNHKGELSTKEFADTVHEYFKTQDKYIEIQQLMEKEMGKENFKKFMNDGIRLFS